ncbi:S-type pyocin domain-containing protein, partial [Acerihabitans sp. TG2]|uniref:S-type pyocin domain-containing protein n=1 Tax=Acerihabitans sp. TG2 TaxID=3096008 RepID=UPI002B221E67
LPTEQLNLPPADILMLAANGLTTVRSNIHGRLVNIGGTLHVELYKTDKFLPIRALVAEPVTTAGKEFKGVFKSTVPATDDFPARTIFITPGRAPGSRGLRSLVTPNEGPKSIANTGNQTQPVQLPVVTTYPDFSGIDNSVIVVPPLDSGYQPIYIMFASPRDLPGTVTGQGQKVGNNWLADAATENGAPIPAQVADKLRDKRFNSFD